MAYWPGAVQFGAALQVVVVVKVSPPDVVSLTRPVVTSRSSARAGWSVVGSRYPVVQIRAASGVSGTATASGSSAAVALFKPVNPSLATTSPRSRRPGAARRVTA